VWCFWVAQGSAPWRANYVACMEELGYTKVKHLRSAVARLDTVLATPKSRKRSHTSPP